MTRDEVLRIMRQASTLEQVEEAMRIVGAWIDAHPTDWPIRREAERLLMLEWALRGISGVGESAV